MFYAKFLAQNLRLSNPAQIAQFTAKPILTRIFVILFNGLGTTSLVVIFWASLWDILYTTVYPENIPLSLLITWACGNILLFTFYLSQDLLQSLHSKLATSFSLGAYILRALYAYLISLAYVFNYRSYWDAYVYYTVGIDWRVFLGLAVFSVGVYRLVCGGEWDALNESVPFNVTATNKYDEFFMLNSFVETKKVWLNRILDFFYYEFIVGLYFIIIWRGVYDLVETGANDLFKNSYPDNYVTISLLFVFSWSFSIYLFIMFFQHFFQPSLTKLLGIRLTPLIIDILEFAIYILIVAYWRVVWEAYDLLAYIEEAKEYRTLIFYVSHFVSFAVLFILGMSVCISGGAMEEMDFTDEGSWSKSVLVDEIGSGRQNYGYSSNRDSVIKL